MARTKFMASMTPDERSRYMSALRSRVESPGFANVDTDKVTEISKLGVKKRQEINEALKANEKNSVQDETEKTQT